MRVKNSQTFYTISILLIINILIYWRWFFNFGTLTYGDWGYVFHETIKDYFIQPSIWSESSFGNVLITISSAPVRIIWGILSYSVSFELAERLLYLWPSILITSISIYFLAKKFLNSKTALFVTSLTYSYSTYFILGRTGSLTLEMAYAIAPFFLLAFINYLENFGVRYLVITSTLGAILGFYEFRAFYLVAWVCVFYFLFDLIFSKDKLVLWRIILKGCKASFPFILILILNIFWILPLFFTSSISDNSTFSRGLFGNGFMNITESIAAFHPFWSGEKYVAFVVNPIPYYFFLMPIFAYLGLILNRKNKYFLFFGFISLLGVFLAKQADIPFPGTYQWLYNHLPGFNAFRESSKMYFFIALGYSILIGSFIDWLWVNWNVGKEKIFLKYFFTCLILLVIFWNTKPIVTGELGSIMLARQIPPDYLVLKDFIINQNDNFRTIWVPNSSRWGFYNIQNPKLDAIDTLQSNFRNFNKKNNNFTQAENIINFLEKTYTNQLADISWVKYFVVPSIENSLDARYFKSINNDHDVNLRQWYLSKLDKIKWLKRIDIGTKELVVYENDNFKLQIFTFDTMIDLKSMSNMEAKYSLVVENLKKDLYFNTLPFVATSNLISVSNIFENITPKNISTKGNPLIVTIDSTDNNKKQIIKRNLPDGGYGILDTQNNFVYWNLKYNYKNLVNNPSFESGLWQDKIGNCNKTANGEPSEIIQSSNFTEGAYSMQLAPKKQLICAATKISVKPNSRYQLSFDYQSSNTSIATYNVRYDDQAKSNFNEDIKINGKSWNSTFKIINTSSTTHQIYLSVFARYVEGVGGNVIRYDNFNLIEVPDLSDSYYLVSEPKEKLVKPKDMKFELINPTKKIVHIKGATTGFFLGMSESYHPQWQAQFNNNKINGFWNSWIPFVKPDKIPEEYHYKLDDFLNAWYIDVDNYCRENNLCIENTDGSYDIEMVVEFFPQRWFYMGFVISSIAFTLSLLYLLFPVLKFIGKRLWYTLVVKNKLKKE